MKTLKPGHPALKERRTIFIQSIREPSEVTRLLQPANVNHKMGKGKSTIMKGRWSGMKLYLLTLQERRTCPSSCQQWSNCYGNNMPWAKRIDHKSLDFLPSLEAELSTLAKKHSNGFVVRLHVLGDFYNKTYVRFWMKMLKKYPQLHIYGYTHRWPEHKDGIGKEIEKLNNAGAWIRFSDRGGEMSANVNTTLDEGIQCPEEVGKTESCLTCGLCWQTTRSIRFLAH